MVYKFVSNNKPKTLSSDSESNSDSDSDVQLDKQNYSKYRQDAIIQAKEYQKYASLATQALKSGNQKQSAIYSSKARNAQRKMRQLNALAAKYFFSKNNSERDPTVIDLHGLFVSEALEVLTQYISKIQRLLSNGQEHLVLGSKSDVVHLKIITGKGKHSQSKGSRLRPAVISYLKSVGCTFSIDSHNSGIVKCVLKR